MVQNEPHLTITDARALHHVLMFADTPDLSEQEALFWQLLLKETMRLAQRRGWEKDELLSAVWLWVWSHADYAVRNWITATTRVKPSQVKGAQTLAMRNLVRTATANGFKDYKHHSKECSLEELEERRAS